MNKEMLILIILFFQIFSLPLQAAAEKAKVLIIRPEKFYNQSADKAALQRNPFSWSPEQMALYASLKADEIDYFADLTLQAILWDEKAPFAVINNDILAPGEKIKQVTIKQIGREEVILEHDGVLRTFVFKPLVTTQNIESK